LAFAALVNTTSQFVPWSAALGALGGVAGLLDAARSPLGAALRRNVTAPLVTPQLDRFWAGVNGSSNDYIDRKNVELLLPLAVRLNNTRAVAFADQCWQNATANISCAGAAAGVVPPSVQSAVFVNAAMRNVSSFNELLRRYNETTFPSERSRLLGALTRVSDTLTRDKLMAMAVSGDGLIRQQDRNGVFGGIASVSVENRDAVWQFVTSHFSTWTNTTGAIFGGATGIIASIASGFATTADLNMVLQFVADNKLQLGGRDIRQAIERINDNILWIERNEQSVEDFLATI